MTATATSTLDTETRDTERRQVDIVLAGLAGMERGAIDTVAARGRVIESYLPMAVHAARRYSGRGEPLADLVQVAVIGLMKAVDRFDADRGVAFASYAMPTIFGEIKRHFRDTTWTVRVPRSAQELNAQVAIVREDMAHRLYRMPTTPEIAARLHVSERDVLSAQRSAHAYRPLSFEQVSPYGEGLRLGDSLGDLDEQIEVVSDRETLRLCLSVLSEREQRIIGLRFFAGMTQLQIADDIGVSQMQISRLLTRSLAHLRDVMLDDTPPPGERPSPRRQPSGAQ